MEHFIPVDKAQVLAQLLADPAWKKGEAAAFRELFEILEHFFHNESYRLNRELKNRYAPIDPDRDLRDLSGQAGRTAKVDPAGFRRSLDQVLKGGNYRVVGAAELDAAFAASDLVGLKLSIDLEDYDELLIAVRGHRTVTETVGRLFFLKKEIAVELHERVLLYARWKPADYFAAKKRRGLPFVPGTGNLKLFKDVPKNDLETILPNAVPRMNLLDKILLFGPGIGGGIPILTAKVVPAVLGLALAWKSGEALRGHKLYQGMMEGLLALGVLLGYLFRQYNGYVAKKIKFAKMLTESLYFKALGNNAGVFHALLDAAEDEEQKETILAYAFLLRAERPLTMKELDGRIEAWFAARGVNLDFEVDDALAKLARLGLGKKRGGKWTVLPLEKAKRRVDWLWDNLFTFNR